MSAFVKRALVALFAQRAVGKIVEGCDSDVCEVLGQIVCCLSLDCERLLLEFQEVLHHFSAGLSVFDRGALDGHLVHGQSELPNFLVENKAVVSWKFLELLNCLEYL